MKEKYPVLVRRYLASLIDFLVPFTLVIMAGKYMASQFPESPLNPIVFIFIFLIYEPILSTFWATAGQLIFKFRVRRLDEKTKINLWKAYLRYLSKLTLGGVSLLTVPARNDGRALHDLISGSIVVESKESLQKDGLAPTRQQMV